jgi:hypothetical protein
MSCGCFSRYERSLWRAYIEGIATPLNELCELKMTIFTMDVQRDFFLDDLGDLKPKQCFVDNWRARYVLSIAWHGGFCLNPDEPLHPFNQNCPAACCTLFEGIAGREAPELEVVANALVAITEPDIFRPGLNWCDSCFPPRPRAVSVVWRPVASFSDTLPRNGQTESNRRRLV